MLSTRVELDINTIDEIRSLIRPIVHKVAGRYFDDSTTYGDELAASIEDELIEALQVEGDRANKSATLVGGDSVHHAGQIKALLKDVPDDRPVLSQIVGSQTGVYNAYVEVGILNRGEGPVVISAGHPELTHLPTGDNETERNRRIDWLIEELIRLRA